MMKQAQLFYIPASTMPHNGYYAVAEEAEQALKVFKECWTKVAHGVDKERNITLKDLIVIEKEITLPNHSQKVNRILNTYVGLIDIEIIKYFDKPTYFGTGWRSGPKEIPEVSLSPEAWSVYSYDYDGQGRIVFQAEDLESGVKVRVDSERVVWMYTYETDTIYNEVYKDNKDEAIGFALSIIRDAKILREKYRKLFDW
jgi:hypothetical protein